MELRSLSAGESHGQAMTAILEGIPSGLQINIEEIDLELSRRQRGYGRVKRMEIERDRVKILSGVKLGKTMGSPICLMIKNKDWDNWKEIMSPFPEATELPERMTRPRPGHADLTRLIKYRHKDLRDILALYKPIKSVDIETKKLFEASVERSDVCAVPAASVIGESVVAFEIARAFLERYAGDSVDQIKKSWEEDQNYLRTFS
jgi:chorismate synthase